MSIVDPSRPVEPDDPYFWENLLDLMDKGLVVPVVGPDAVVVQGELGPRPLTEYLAPRVERILNLPPGPQPATDLNDVACRHLQHAGAQNFTKLYRAVKRALEEVAPQESEPLRKLARIGAFKLFVTTTFDDLLLRAVTAEWAGPEKVPSFAYWPEHTQDLPAPLESFTVPVVYHLFGRVSPAPEFAVTEEDTLEFMHALQSDGRRPKNLLQELKPASLLILGSRYSDWLARFFLRVAKAERLLKAASRPEVVAESSPDTAIALGGFLKHYSAETFIYPRGPLAFIDELAERWAGHVAAKPAEDQVAADDQPIAQHAIFISYAREDLVHAEALVQALKDAQLPVWLDRSGLEGGDDFDLKIQQQIRVSSIFVALLTPLMDSAKPRYYRKEWRFAADRAKRFSEAIPFVVPVRVGEVPAETPHIDKYIRDLHWLDVSDGEGAGRFEAVVARLQQIYREYRDAREGMA